MDLSDFFDYDNSAAGFAEELVFLRGFSDPDWEALLSHTMTQHHDGGALVLAAGESDPSMYIVADGRLEVFVGEGSAERRVARIEAGSVVGEQSFLDGRPRSASVRAVTDARVLELSRAGFDAFSAKHPELARHFLFDLARILSLRLRQTTALVVLGR